MTKLRSLRWGDYSGRPNSSEVDRGSEEALWQHKDRSAWAMSQGKQTVSDDTEPGLLTLENAKVTSMWVGLSWW